VSAASDSTVLQEVAGLARAGGRLALDTEFMGEGRYRTLLCLIQLAVDDGHGASRIEVVDPLEDELDGAPLAAVLADPAIEIVVHAGRQDVALVRRRFGTEVRNVLDTQIAAGFAGLPAQASYETLLGDVLGVRVAKSASYTRWDTRPLSPEQLDYAREDVVHLLQLASELQDRLSQRGRLTWALQECQFLEGASDERDLETVFSRLPRVHGLRPESQGVAQELVEWRERTAQSQDRPVQTILGDAALIELAKRRPSTPRELEQIRGLHQGNLRRRGEDLLAAVARGRRRPSPGLEQDRRSAPPDADDAPLIALCEALARSRARQAGLAYELVATRADLQAMVTAWRLGAEPAAVRTLAGWRQELVGAELLELLDGKVKLSVDANLTLHVEG
jgi:ribonuclease D